MANDSRHDASRRQSLAEAMARDARAFYAHGWLMGTSGNLSCRLDPSSFLITASGKDKGALSGSDFLVCDLQGEAVGETPHRPSAETLVHCEIYARRAEAGAIYHVHDPFAALCSARDEEAGETRFRGLEMIKGLDVWEEDAEVALPILPNHASIPQLAYAVAEHLEQDQAHHRVPGVNILRHGVYAWGRTAAEAKRHIETLHYLCHYSWHWALRERRASLSSHKERSAR